MTHLLMIPVLAASIASAAPVVQWDFTRGTQGWQPNARVARLTHDADGLKIVCTGHDPWLTSPRFDCPRDSRAFITLRLKATEDDGGEVFYGVRAQAGKSVHFAIHGDGKWHDYRLLIPEPLGPGVMLRFDPGSDEGTFCLASIKVEALAEILLPALPKPRHPRHYGNETTRVVSGDVTFRMHGQTWGAFTICVGDAEMAAGYDGDLLGTWQDDSVQWHQLRDARSVALQGAKENTYGLSATLKDGIGATWTLERIVSAGSVPGTLVVETTLAVDRESQVLHVPWLTIFPGLDTFGERKHQGVFAGIEYLCDEPSSSEADVAAPKNVRRVPSAIKLAYPLMAIEHDQRYIGVTWERSVHIAPIFDSPDRVFNSGAHVMALAAPEVGTLRIENDPYAHSPFEVSPERPICVRATIVAGTGRTIMPAVKHYVALKGFPEIPKFTGEYGAATELMSHGWLDSGCNMDGVFRHAVWHDKFMARRPAGEAIMFIDWLAHHVSDKALQTRLEELRDLALSKHAPSDPFSGRISHARVTSAPFVLGRLPEFITQKIKQAEAGLKRFDERGVKFYRPRKDKPDYGKTHFAKHANGLAASDVASILYAATLCGRESLKAQALDLLDKQTVLYANTVPRGAQTWEVPLHTPDILASANMTKAYVLGHLLSDDPKHLEQARYWAWTGVPFLYLDPPVKPGEAGVYATTAVLGATNWRAPYWIGLPVQWCGLAYASALHYLSDCDRAGPWAKIAKGITAAGLRMSWPASDNERQGLLPDFFHLDRQMSAGPAINPGTVQAHLPELYGRGKLYDIKPLRSSGWLVHAPCAISDAKETGERVEFSLDGWGKKDYRILVAGGKRRPDRIAITREGGAPWQPVDISRVRPNAEDGYTVIHITGACRLRMQ